MEFGRILVAADTTPESEHALRIGMLLAGRSKAGLAVVRVREPGEPAVEGTADSGGLPLTFRRDGVPGIEIARCAEQWRADLVVLGRNHASMPELGATTQMVLRRRHGQTLLVPRHVGGFERILYALDGSERGLGILHRGGHLPSVTGGRAMAVCVLPPDSVEPNPEARSPHPRLTRVEGAMSERPDLGGMGALVMRWGEPVAEVLRHLAETAADLLILGLRQGGPRGDPGSGHVARDLLHSVSTAILTIPI